MNSEFVVSLGVDKKIIIHQLANQKKVDEISIAFIYGLRNCAFLSETNLLTVVNRSSTIYQFQITSEKCHEMPVMDTKENDYLISICPANCNEDDLFYVGVRYGKVLLINMKDKKVKRRIKLPTIFEIMQMMKMKNYVVCLVDFESIVILDANNPEEDQLQFRQFGPCENRIIHEMAKTKESDVLIFLINNELQSLDLTEISALPLQRDVRKR